MIFCPPLNPTPTFAALCCGEADIQELICVDDVMEKLSLGPNGALMYCMEYVLASSCAWLICDTSASSHSPFAPRCGEHVDTTSGARSRNF